MVGTLVAEMQLLFEEQEQNISLTTTFILKAAF